MELFLIMLAWILGIILGLYLKKGIVIFIVLFFILISILFITCINPISKFKVHWAIIPPSLTINKLIKFWLIFKQKEVTGLKDELKFISL